MPPPHTLESITQPSPECARSIKESSVIELSNNDRLWAIDIG